MITSATQLYDDFGTPLNHFTVHNIEIGISVVVISVAGWHSVELSMERPSFNRTLRIYCDAWNAGLFDGLDAVVNAHPEWLGTSAPANQVWSPYIATPAWVNDPTAIVTVATWDTLSIVANGISAATLGPALPNPSTLSIKPPADLGIADIADQVVVDGVFQLTTTIAGEYKIMVSAANYQDYEVTISAT